MVSSLFLIDGYDPPEGLFRQFFFPDIQYPETVFNKFLIVSQGIHSIQVQPQELPVLSLNRMVLMMLHAMDEK